MRFSPGPLVAAAFIGPGTVTTATLAGADYGYALLWGIVFSAVATVILQEMAMRIGVVGREDLGGALRRKLGNGTGFWAVAALVVAAIGLGNAAYEGGNIAGAVLGAQLLLPDGTPSSAITLAIVLAAGGLLYLGSGAPLRAVLTVAVALMSLGYVLACALAPVDWSAVLGGLVQVRLPSGAELRVIGLIGTTVVPYNLFLHASTARDFYVSAEELPAARRDLYLSVGVGAVVTLAIAVLAAALKTEGTDVTSGADLAQPLVAVVGAFGRWVVGLGYLAAGLTSAITAPLATALALSGLFAFTAEEHPWGYRAVWATILAAGATVVTSGARPIGLIAVAQVANGLLLPVIAACVVWVANDARRLGGHRNGTLANVLGAGITAVTVVLAGRSLYNVFAA